MRPYAVRCAKCILKAIGSTSEEACPSEAPVSQMNRMPKEKYVRVCPSCGGTDVSHEQSPSYVIQSVALTGFQCNDCGCTVQTFPEVPSLAIERKVAIKTTSQIPVSGNFVIYAALAILWLIGLLVYVATRGL